MCEICQFKFLRNLPRKTVTDLYPSWDCAVLILLNRLYLKTSHANQVRVGIARNTNLQNFEQRKRMQNLYIYDRITIYIVNLNSKLVLWKYIRKLLQVIELKFRIVVTISNQCDKTTLYYK